MLIKITYLFILVCSFSTLSGQLLTVPLQVVKENAGRTATTNLFDKDDVTYDPNIVYKGIPPEITSYIIKTLDFQPEQGIYELFLQFGGKMPVEALIQGLRPYNLSINDTVHLSHVPVKHFVSFLVGKNNNGYTVIIGDSNNDYNFSDEKLFVFTDEDNPLYFKKTVRFTYQYAYRGKVFENFVYLGMSPASSNITYVNPIEQEFFLVVSLEEHKVGFFETGDTSVMVNVELTQFPSATYNATNTRIHLGKKSQFYEIGDSVLLAPNKYVISGINFSGDTLYLTQLSGRGLVYGTYPGSFAFPLVATDFITNKIFNSRNLSRKFVLLDFWGSWCKPCIKAIPELVRFSEKYGDQLHIVSIAEDFQDQKDSIKALIRDQGMMWTHLFEDIRDTSKTTISKKFKIESYPTQILLNPEGKIVYRSTLTSKLTEDQLNCLLAIQSEAKEPQ